MLIVIKQENVQTGGLGISGHLATQIGQLAQVASQGGQTPSQPRTPSAGGTIWKAADYLLEKELLTFALEHRQVSFFFYFVVVLVRFEYSAYIGECMGTLKIKKKLDLFEIRGLLACKRASKEVHLRIS